MQMNGLPKAYYDDGRGIRIYLGDCRKILFLLEQHDACLTSPPYNLRKGYPCDDWPTWNNYYGFLRGVYGAVPAPIQAWLFPFSLNDEDSGLIRATWNECALPWKRLRLVLRHPSVDDSKSLIAMPPRAEILCINTWAEENGPKIWWVPHAKFAASRLSMRVGHPASFHERLPAEFFAAFPTVKSVIDPFMGTGTTLVVAKQRGIQATGIEIVEEFAELAVKRLAQEMLPLRAPALEPEQGSLI